MAIVTFYGDGNKETGNTAAAIATATYMAIKHNMKILFISTNFNENTARECFWQENNRRTILQTGQNMVASTIQSGIEGLSRLVGSSKIEPRLIKDYTKVILANNRFDILLGYNGEKKEYKEIQQIYARLIPVAGQYYDMVIIDVDRKLEMQVRDDIVNIADIKIITTNQRIKDIQCVANKIENSEKINKKDVLMVLGRYDAQLKINAKNVSRSILKQRRIINTVPYNGRYYEAMQDGSVIDLFLKLDGIKNRKDPNYIFMQEIGRLIQDINSKWQEVRMKKGRI